jgi:hypothetical protein
MKTHRNRVGLAAGLAGTFVLGLLLPQGIRIVWDGLFPPAQAQMDKPNSRRCSAVTLKGAYGIRFTGVSLAQGQFASISRIVFDGNGTFTTTEIGRLNGQPVNRTFTGPYVVNRNCTGFLDFSSTLSNPPHEAHGEFVITDEGRSFFVVDDEDGWVASGEGRRL